MPKTHGILVEFKAQGSSFRLVRRAGVDIVQEQSIGDNGSNGPWLDCPEDDEAMAEMLFSLYDSVDCRSGDGRKAAP